jgi:putative NADH-flavin reductase
MQQGSATTRHKEAGVRLAIFGATGRTGRELVNGALNAGHEVVALVRRPDALPAREGVQAVAGDARDPEAVARAVAGADAVLVALGHTRGSGTDVLSAGTRAIVEAMRDHGVSRLVVLSGAGVRVKGDPVAPGTLLMRGLLKTLARALIADAEAQYRVVSGSGLEWTVVRAPRLTNARGTARYRAGTGMALGPRDQVPRADVAEFMLSLVEDPRFVRDAPLITGAV